MIRADSHASRQAMFANLRESSVAARLAYRLHERLGASWAASLFVSCYGLKSFLGTAAPPDSRLLAIAVHANARKQVNRVAEWFDPAAVVRLGVGKAGVLHLSALSRLFALVTARRDVTRALRVIHTVNGRYGFLVSCRVASVIACYARAWSILRPGRWRAVVVSSDTNPEELAFTTVARDRGMATIFIAHAYPSPFSPPLAFSLSLLEGEAAVDARRQIGAIEGEVFLLGLEGESAPLDPARLERPQPVIGIFAPKVVAWPKLIEIIDDCRRHFHASEVVIRWHPSMLEPPRLDRVVPDTSRIVETAASESLASVLSRCDWVVADENSNVHLPVLKLGVPTVAVRELEGSPRGRSDIYGFHAHGIVFPPVSSLKGLSTADLVAFFSNDWPQRFTRYDASYLRSAALLECEARRAIERVLTNGIPVSSPSVGDGA